MPDAGPQVRPGGPARELIDERRALAAAAAAVLARLDDARTQVARLVTDEREARMRGELAGVAVERLADITEANLRIQALRSAGYASALDVLDATPDQLEAHDGIGRHTARCAVAAAEQLADAVRAGVRLRIELRRDAGLGLELLTLLHRVERLTPLVEPHRRDLTDFSSSVAALAPVAEPATRRLAFVFTRGESRRRALAALASLAGWEPWLTTTRLADVVSDLEAHCRAPEPGPLALWEDFERRAAAYYALLGQIVPMGDLTAADGMLPAELVERINAYPLDRTLLRVTLRGYQAFGARFALNQGRAMLGDEMGLGKTIQAVAAMAHLAAQGERHFLVVCPASVLINWTREVTSRSALAAHRLHGAGREEAIARWVAEGGVGVTTFEGLRHVPVPPARPEASSADDGAPVGPAVGMLVVDEAHFVKNPRAQRSRTVATWTQRCWRVLFMTGTPMENRLEEFAALVRYLQPGLVAELPAHLGLAGADLFRHRMAPVYLRRNVADVLVELPELVTVDEWEEFTPAGERAYRAAVAEGNFMAMRRADFAVPHARDSAKLTRLLELVGEAGENGHKVVVFSYFRDVIDRIVDALGPAPDGVAFGPVTGSVPAAERQRLVDDFTAGPAGAVLVCQVQAGGVGLNIQAASIVVLAEPQLKPAAEAQAVARAHRMGQVRTVQVHRLLVEDSVDERIEAILGEKTRLFDAYVRDSSLAEGAVAAVDVSESELARHVVAEEQARLGYGPVWDELAAQEPSGQGDQPAATG
ncbi:DEAD/DEAH box helicase [Georgenia faecalis]|uniref:DEAD/DEAH box helicase n=1 Tax=Georgenia faecalis TaxID=2483799 RepID=A0ABV9D5K9_9MICO|nr:DEAD/DEAH box helicase [Georgenia faecalis]